LGTKLAQTVQIAVFFAPKSKANFGRSINTSPYSSFSHAKLSSVPRVTPSGGVKYPHYTSWIWKFTIFDL